MKRIFIAVSFSILITNFLDAQDIQTDIKKQYKAVQINIAPVIDGVLDEEAWNAGNWVNDFIQY